VSLPNAYARTEADETVDVTMTVNGSEVTLSLPARVTLSDALRDHLGLTGTHVGCEHGICGMCTILVDGQASRACLLFAVQLDGADITTVEGLGRQDDLHPLQESFSKHHALQCGFCTPGFLMSSYDLLTHEPDVATEDLPEELSGVLCRCTGYRNIIDAVDEVAHAHRDGLPGPGNCAQRTLVGRTPAEVARVFNDIRLLARCLPGAELTDELGDDWYRGRARIALGPVRLSFDGMAHVLEQRDDRLVLKGQGKDTGGGSAQAEIVMSATPSGTGVSLHAEARVFLTGRIASFGRSLAGDVSRRMFEDFARSMDRAAAGAEPDVSAKPPGAMAILFGALSDRARTRFRNLRQRSKVRTPRRDRRRTPSRDER
jgi:carbon-monoxide dehydrogenase small subunit